MPNIELARSFCGLDPGADTAVLDMCLKSAVQWYEKAGVPEPAEGENTDDYDFWVCNLAAWMYDNRGAGEDIPPYILASIHQLRPITTEETST